MKYGMWIVVVVADTTPKGVFSMLKVGQPVSLKDHGSAFSLSFIEGEVPFGHTVVEVGEDYVVVRDIAGVKDIVVPVFALKAVEKVRVEVE